MLCIIFKYTRKCRIPDSASIHMKILKFIDSRLSLFMLLNSSKKNSRSSSRGIPSAKEELIYSVCIIQQIYDHFCFRERFLKIKIVSCMLKSSLFSLHFANDATLSTCFSTNIVEIKTANDLLELLSVGLVGNEKLHKNMIK